MGFRRLDEIGQDSRSIEGSRGHSRIHCGRREKFDERHLRKIQHSTEGERRPMSDREKQFCGEPFKLVRLPTEDKGRR